MRWAGALLIAAACNQVFDLKPTEAVPELGDRDKDGIADIKDNCLELANPTQSDDDADGLGDACDNCPLVANPDQDNLGDHDPTGDLCDPHPADDGDCLAVFDTFADPTALATGWMVATGAAGVHPEASALRLDASAADPVTLYALDEGGEPVTGAYSIQLAARVTFSATVAEVSVFTTASAPTTGLRCGVGSEGSPTRPVLISSAGVGRLSSAPFGDLVTIRLVPEIPTGTPALKCRIDYGIAIGVAASPVTQALQGTTGVYATQPSALDGIALYRYMPGQACPTPVIR